MSGKPEHFEELTRLISGVLDGRMEAAERARLELLLESDPAARALYLQMVHQEIELECLVVPESRAVPAPAARERESARWTPLSYAVLAAAAVITLLLMIWLDRDEAAPAPPAAATARQEWVADFEAGSVEGWIGEIVSRDLPPGSARAIRAIETREPRGTFYNISAPADWRAGLATLTRNSTLHITYRIGSATWVNVFAHMAGAAGEAPSMFQLAGSGFPGAPDQWQTASIPFSLFQRKVWDDAAGGLTFTGGGPRDGERLATLVFSAPHRIDLTIDRIWITPDGTGVETVTPLQ